MPSLPDVFLSYAQWGLLAHMGFSVWITLRIAARFKREALASGKPGSKGGAAWFSNFLVFTLFSSLLMAAVLLPIAIAERASVFVTGTETVATVVSFSSRQERVTREDSDGRSYSETVTLHTPDYELTLANGKLAAVQGDISSENEPVVGTRQTIFYDAARERMVTASVGNVMLLCVGAMFSFFFVLALYATLRYAFGRSTAGVMRLMGQGLMNVVIPGSMGLMAFGLLWYAYPRLMGQRDGDDPIFIAIVCVVVAAALLTVAVRWVQARLASD